MMLAIGSIIIDTHPKFSNKIVFGSGYGGYTKIPTFDSTWKFYCVRGPMTAKACGLQKSSIAGDAAILINKHTRKSPKPKYEVSFMPHWESIGYGHWKRACRLAGINFIDPTMPVETVLRSIQESKLLIAEAMHGAIVADALRVPWIPVSPIKSEHRLKWFDWAEGVGVNLHPRRLLPSSIAETKFGRAHNFFVASQHQPVKSVKYAADSVFVSLAALRLHALSKTEPSLSSDIGMSNAVSRLEENAYKIKMDFLQ